MISFTDYEVMKSSHRHSEVSLQTSHKKTERNLTAAGAPGSNYAQF